MINSLFVLLLLENKFTSVAVAERPRAMMNIRAWRDEFMNRACPCVFWNTAPVRAGIWFCWRRRATYVATLSHLSCRSRQTPCCCETYFTIALCCWASCAAGAQTTTAAVARQSFLCRGPSAIWPLTGNSRGDSLLIRGAAVMRRRQGASHLAWPIMNRGQRDGHRGKSREHLAMVIAVRAIYSSLPEEWFPCVCGSDRWNHYVTIAKRAAWTIPPRDMYFFMIVNWSFSPALLHEGSKHITITLQRVQL